MTSSPQMGTAVLVHGAWADGSCWNNVILPLKSKGFMVTCAPLPLTSFEDDAAALRRVVERTNGPVILVGHAYAGSVIAAVQDDRVKSLVYIAALAPDEGETVGDVFYKTVPHPNAPQVSPDVHGLIWMPEDGFSQAVAHKASSDQLAIMAAVQRPISVNCIQEKVATPSWKTKPSWFLLAEEDRMINPATQQFMAERMKANVRSHKVDHTPMHTAPDLVVSIILEAAQSTLAK
ncbi:alpha/beta fold hydrolase [Granulicella sp. S156]|uniref:alpha/beta fold hydrolase n=1 Tax=Granulicella sp. S156 TaxID=1747224 RepID=UPI0020B10DE5|nr:alpha/beta hydrolase [Granulicella sp. S156]